MPRKVLHDMTPF
uniref:Uncharacterized protein n=1 Tax=Rhizophora mucronata TaxID=61149 RepID=A0A2P2N9T9_RHIMU